MTVDCGKATGEGTASGELIVTVGSLPYRDKAWERGERIKEKLLAALKLGSHRSRRGGSLAWWEARIAVGGRVKSAEFRRCVEELMAAGRLVEIWTFVGFSRERGHRLVLVGFRSSVRHRIEQARGRRDRIEDEYCDVRNLDESKANTPSIQDERPEVTE